MAEFEERIGALETQMRLLKGEISKSLLDIRAVVMKAEAPLTDGRSLMGSSPLMRRGREQDEAGQFKAHELQNIPPSAPPAVVFQAKAQVPMPPPTMPPSIPASAQTQAATGWPDPQLPTAHLRDNPQSYHPQDNPGNGFEPTEVPERGQRGRPPMQGQGVRRSASNAPERRAPGESRGSLPLQKRQSRHRDIPRMIQKEEVEEDLLAQEQELMTEYGLGTNGTRSVNLLTNLVHWTSMARQRMDQDRLMQFLDLYTRWGAKAPGLKEIVTDICTMLQDDQGLHSEDGHHSLESEGWINLMLQLHGVLTEARVVLAESENIMKWAEEDPVE